MCSGFLIAVVACEAVGALGATVTVPAGAKWLPTLDQPSFQPPDWVFGPVWTSLCTLIEVSWRLTHKAQPGTARRSAERWLAIQLMLNGLWSFIFFGRRRIGWSLIDSMALAVAVGITVNKVPGSRPSPPLCSCPISCGSFSPRPSMPLYGAGTPSRSQSGNGANFHVESAGNTFGAGDEALATRTVPRSHPHCVSQIDAQPATSDPDEQLRRTPAGWACLSA